MRQFIGIHPGAAAARELTRLSAAVRACTQGSFTRTDNMHLTVLFLGEVDEGRLQDVKAAMDSAALAPLSLRLSAPGSFSRGGTAILWCGVSGDVGLLARIHGELAAAMSAAGVPFDDKPLVPHITLARQARFRDGGEVYGKLRPACVDFGADELVLYHSTRIAGELRYIPIYKRRLC